MKKNIFKAITISAAMIGIAGCAEESSYGVIDPGKEFRPSLFVTTQFAPGSNILMVADSYISYNVMRIFPTDKVCYSLAEDRNDKSARVCNDTEDIFIKNNSTVFFPIGKLNKHINFDNGKLHFLLVNNKDEIVNFASYGRLENPDKQVAAFSQLSEFKAPRSVELNKEKFTETGEKGKITATLKPVNGISYVYRNGRLEFNSTWVNRLGNQFDIEPKNLAPDAITVNKVDDETVTVMLKDGVDFSKVNEFKITVALEDNKTGIIINIKNGLKKDNL